MIFLHRRQSVALVTKNSLQLKDEGHPNQIWACFVHYIKNISTLIQQLQILEGNL